MPATMSPMATTTAVGESATAWVLADAANIATNTVDIPEGASDTRRPTAPRLPGARRRPFRIGPDPERTDFRLELLL
jgi:hypothetical protein